MSGNARFHDKLHRSNHHTAATPGLPDSSYDPIASPEKPFRGDFVLSGSLSSRNEIKSSSFETGSAKITNKLVLSGTNGGVLTNSNSNISLVNSSNSLSINYDGGVYLKNNLTLTNNGVISAKLPGGIVHTDNLGPAYTLIKDQSASWNAAALWAGTPTTPADITVNGDLTVNEDLLVLGNLTALGSTKLINVTATTTDALCVYNADPTRPALDITQVLGNKTGVVLKHLGTGNILSAVGSVGGTNFVINSAGYVGLGTNNPKADLQIVSGVLALEGQSNLDHSFFSTLPASAVSGSYIYFGNLGTGVTLTTDYALIRQIGAGDLYHLTLDLYNNPLGPTGQKFSIRNNNTVIVGKIPTPLFHINEYGNVGINTDQQGTAGKLYISGGTTHLEVSETTSPCICAYGQRSPWHFYHYSKAAGNNDYSVSKYYSASGTMTNPASALSGTGHSFRIIPYVQGTDSLGAITGTWANDKTKGGAADITLGYETKPTINDLRGYISFSTANGSAEGSSNPSEEKVRITSSGNVGIGTDAPNKKLTIFGDISATGDITVDNYQPLKQGSFVTSLTELNALTAGNRKYSQSEIFNTWYRYSHSSNSFSDHYNTAEENSWALTNVGGVDYIKSTQNTGSNVGFISEANYKKYLHEVRFFSQNNDDDDNGLVIARYVDPANGNTHTLTLKRSPGNPQDMLFTCINAVPAATFTSAPADVQQMVRNGGNSSNSSEHLSSRGIVIGDIMVGAQNTGEPQPSSPSYPFPDSSSNYKTLLSFNKSLSNNFRLDVFNRFFREYGNNTDTPDNPEGSVYLPALCGLSASYGRSSNTDPINIGSKYPYTATTDSSFTDFAIFYNLQHKFTPSIFDTLQNQSREHTVVVSHNIKDITHYDTGWLRACNASGSTSVTDAGGVKLKVVRDNNIIKCYTTNFYTIKTEIDSTDESSYVAMISCDLSDTSKSYLQKFIAQLPYGYFNWSQPDTYFEILKFVDTFDVQYDGKTYTYDPETNAWSESELPFTPETDFATGKFSRDHFNAKTYYVQNANTILPIAKWYSSINEDQRNQKVSIDNELTLVTTTTSHPVSSFTMTPSAVKITTPNNDDNEYLICYVNGSKKYIPLYS
jgi:hypothetical protein